MQQIIQCIHVFWSLSIYILHWELRYRELQDDAIHLIHYILFTICQLIIYKVWQLISVNVFIKRKFGNAGNAYLSDVMFVGCNAYLTMSVQFVKNAGKVLFRCSLKNARNIILRLSITVGCHREIIYVPKPSIIHCVHLSLFQQTFAYSSTWEALIG